jgi:hypothetical protein
VQVLHTPEKTTIGILSQVIEMPLNQNKSLTPGGKSRGEKTTTDNSESSNVLIWRSLRVYSGRSCRTETTAGANRIRLRKREKERRKKESSKQKKKKRNETNGVGKEKKKISFLSSINLTPFWATPYSSARITLCLVLFFFFFFFPKKTKMNRRRSSSSNMSRALYSREHTTEFLVVAVVGSGSVVPVWNTRELERERDKRDGS